MRFVASLTIGLVLASGGAMAAAPAQPPSKVPLADEQGRHFIPHGFVTITEDSLGEVRYTADDYRKMLLLGANFQVIRIVLGKLGGWPGYAVDPAYLHRLDEMVALGRQAGMKSAFKLTVYDVGQPPRTGSLRKIRRDLYLDRDHRQDLWIAAWRRIFERFRDDPSVFGYDLINEPCATRARRQIWELEPQFKDSQTFQREFFVPFYRKIIDQLHAISGQRKWALFQPYHVPPPVHMQTHFPCLPLTVPLERTGILFAAHYYGDDPALAVRRYTEDAATSHAPLFFGEYGKATFLSTDRDPATQAAYKQVLIETVAEFDRHALGCVKAWWCGSRVFDRSVKRNPKSENLGRFLRRFALGRRRANVYYRRDRQAPTAGNRRRSQEFSF